MIIPRDSGPKASFKVENGTSPMQDLLVASIMPWSQCLVSPRLRSCKLTLTALSVIFYLAQISVKNYEEEELQSEKEEDKVTSNHGSYRRYGGIQSDCSRTFLKDASCSGEIGGRVLALVLRVTVTVQCDKHR